MDKRRLSAVCTQAIAILRSSQTFNLDTHTWLSRLLESLGVKTIMADEVYEAISLEAHTGVTGSYLSTWVSSTRPTNDEAIALLEKVMEKYK